MTARLTFLNWCAAAVFALVLSGACLLDVPSEVELRIDTIRSQLEAQEQDQKLEQQEARFSAAARSMCGENAGWNDLGGGTVQCRTKRGHKTIVAQVTP